MTQYLKKMMKKKNGDGKEMRDQSALHNLKMRQLWLRHSHCDKMPWRKVEKQRQIRALLPGMKGWRRRGDGTMSRRCDKRDCAGNQPSIDPRNNGTILSRTHNHRDYDVWHTFIQSICVLWTLKEKYYVPPLLPAVTPGFTVPIVTMLLSAAFSF